MPLSALALLLAAALLHTLAPVSYAGAVREVSVVFGALAGWRLFGEQLGPRRLIGAGLIFAGIVLLAALG